MSLSDAVPFVHNSRFYAVETNNGRTYVIVNHPKAGTWTIATDGNVPITRIRQAVGLPKPHVRAKVRGKGRSRVLRWKLKKIRGQVVTFVETGRNVRRMIASTSTANGSVHFTPADGPAGIRKIEAIVQQDNRPRTTLTVASYRAPAALKPGRASKIKLTRKGTRLTVRWTPHPAGFRTAVYAQFSDGRRLVTVAAAKHRSVTFIDVRATTTAKITLTGLTAGNAKGPVSHARLRRNFRLGWRHRRSITRRSRRRSRRESRDRRDACPRRRAVACASIRLASGWTPVRLRSGGAITAKSQRFTVRDLLGNVELRSEKRSPQLDGRSGALFASAT